MTVKTLYSLAAAVGLCLTSGTYAQQSGSNKAASVNQKLADEVASRIGKSGVAEGAKVSLTAQNGVVELSGDVLNMKQAEMLVQQAMSVRGVIKVETSLRMMPGSDIKPVEAPEPPAMAFGPGGQVLPQEPLPVAAPGMPNFDAQGPKLPPYAWPTYAPYPNLSRVAYPQSYPYNAFPYIGPYYPYPKVPLGWRKVSLEWEDGHWYLGRLSTPHDYWKVRFW